VTARWVTLLSLVGACGPEPDPCAAGCDTLPEDTERVDSDTGLGETDTDPIDTDTDTDTDTDPIDTDTDPIESDGESDLDSDLPETGPTDSDHTAAIDSDTDPVVVDTTPPVPPSPTCTFLHRIVAPTDEYRSIDLQTTNFENVSWPLNMDASTAAFELTAKMRHGPYGPKTIYMNSPDIGRVPYQNLIVSEIWTSRIADFAAQTPNEYVDLNADGIEEWVGRRWALGKYDLIIFDIGIGIYVPENPDWIITGLDDVFSVFVDDVNGDGIDDLWISVDNYAISGYDSYIAYGPIPKGSYDISSISDVHGEWPNQPSNIGWGGIGDFNGDGEPDLFLNQYQPGYTDRVEPAVIYGPLPAIISPQDVDVYFRHPLQHIYQWASPMINVGDVDGNGADDFIGIMNSETIDGIRESGAAYLFKGPFPPGAVLTPADADATIVWPQEFARTGIRATALDDMDGDGLPEFAIAAWARSDLRPPGVDMTPTWPPPPTPPDTDVPDSDPPDTDTPIDTDAPIDTDLVTARARRAAGDTDDLRHSGDTVDDTYTRDTYSQWGHDTAWDTGWVDPLPFGYAEGAIMVFGNPPDGRLGPEHAKFVILGDNPGDLAGGWYVLSNPHDLDGDGLGDIAYGTLGNPGATIRVLHPCSDFGVR
jgi:hypothetical protein